MKIFTPEDMDRIMREKEPPVDPDLVLMGDGSGTTADKSCGWCVFAHDRRSGIVTRLTGALSHGTNNVAELAPYVQALWHYHVTHFKNDSRGSAAKPIVVFVLSDSEVTVCQGMKTYRRDANGCFWNAVAWFEANSYQIFWRHLSRNSTPIHEECDRVGRECRVNHLHP